MKVIRSILLAFAATAALAAAPAALARGGAPLVTFDDVAIATSDGKKPPLDRVKTAVIRAASDRGWVASVKNPNTVRATYTKGKHSAVVDVVYSQSSYSIRYVDSTDLNYSSDKDGKPTIHPAYNKAVTALRQKIDGALRIIN
jgi:hypothetical protein